MSVSLSIKRVGSVGAGSPRVLTGTIPNRDRRDEEPGNRRSAVPPPVPAFCVSRCVPRLPLRRRFLAGVFVMKKRILVIDDEAALAYMIKFALEREGYYHVRTEDDPAQAIEAALSFGPDLILL